MLGNHLLGLYEKALPADLTWLERLTTAAKLGHVFASGKPKTEGVVSKTFPIEQWETAFDFATGCAGDFRLPSRFSRTRAANQREEHTKDGICRADTGRPGRGEHVSWH